MVSTVEVREINQPDIVYDDNDAVVFERHDGVELRPEEIAFVEYYVGECNFNAAAAFAKVRGKRVDWNSIGHHWMTKPHIIKAVRWRLDAIGASQSEALANLKKIASAEWRDHIIIKARNGEEVEVKLDLMPIVRANEVILKAHGALDQKNGPQVAVQVNINTNIPESDLA